MVLTEQSSAPNLTHMAFLKYHLRIKGQPLVNVEGSLRGKCVILQPAPAAPGWRDWRGAEGWCLTALEVRLEGKFLASR